MAEKRLEEIREDRLKTRQRLIEAHKVPYPSEVRRTHTLTEIKEKFAELKADSAAIILIGRVVATRKHGGLAFLDISDSEQIFQLQLNRDQMGDRFSSLNDVDTGDWVEAAGELGLTKRGDQALVVSDLHIVTKSIRPMPSEKFGLKDQEQRFRQREVDLWLNRKTREVVLLRSKVIAWLRDYLREAGYIEVETPVLQTIAGGAAARPFTTHHNALDMPLHLRIAAELYLKRLLVGGFEKVFEIERRFRNEGVSTQHNPEFTMLESQWALADYEDLMDFTEEVLDMLCREVMGKAKISWQGKELDFGKPLKRKRYVDLMNKRLGVDVLKERDVEVYKDIFKREKLELPESHNYYQLVDELYKELVRPTLVQPVMIYDYPAEMAPLAKRSASDPRVAEKFQLVAAGLELNNCYTELNDPVLQRLLLEEQQKDREAGDEEAHQIEEEYLRALEYGMPPNAGWSLGIDRLVMLLADVPSIRETILFPLLRPEK